ncbi:MAG TPA: DUF917 domain-containing protein [Bacillota bacterium]|nr:DUF917 domain-containing protein [Bacillota bacterium]
MERFQKESIPYLLKGLSIMGTGGGGEAEWGRILLENEFNKGREIYIVQPSEIEDDSFVCSGGIMGSVKSLGNVSFSDITAKWEKSFPLLDAVKLMEQLKGKKVDYLIPFEAGGLNTPVIMAVAARFGIPVIDADGNGRSTPETQMNSFTGFGINLYPMPLVDSYGNKSVVMHSNLLTYADEVGRLLIVKGGGLGANAHYPMSGKQVKRSLVPHTISKAIRIGKILENATNSEDDPINILSQFLNAKILFVGKIKEIQGIDKGGFYLNNLLLTDKNEQHKAQLLIKNETMALWVDNRLLIMLPDIIYMLDPSSGEGISTVNLKKGMDVVLLGANCHEKIQKTMLTEEGKLAFSPARYGYSKLEYFPFNL